MTTTLRDRLLGGMLGLLVGDALGVPYEFKRPDEIPDPVTMTPPRGYGRAHRVAPGTWSDDGSQALVLLDSLLDTGWLDPADVGRRLVDWRYHGAYWVDRHVFDCGIATGRAIDRLTRGVAATEAGPSGERDNGNGSLMRLLPLALWHKGTDAELVADAALQSRITHGHVTSRVCCEVYAVWARRLLSGLEPAAALEDALAAYGRIRPEGTEEAVALSRAVQPLVTDTLDGSGYVVGALRLACTCSPGPTRPTRMSCDVPSRPGTTPTRRGASPVGSRAWRSGSARSRPTGWPRCAGATSPTRCCRACWPTIAAEHRTFCHPETQVFRSSRGAVRG